MENTDIVLIAAALAAKAFLIWLIYKCCCVRQSDSAEDVERGDDGFSEDETFRTRDVGIGIRKRHPLIIHVVKEQNVTIPNSTRRKHIFWGNQSQVTH